MGFEIHSPHLVPCGTWDGKEVEYILCTYILFGRKMYKFPVRKPACKILLLSLLIYKILSGVHYRLLILYKSNTLHVYNTPLMSLIPNTTPGVINQCLRYAL